MKKIEIPLNKKYTNWLLLCAIAFMAAGVLFTTNPDWFTFRSTTQNMQVIRAAGILFTALFGLVSIYGVNKILGKQTGLIIDENGIVDSTASSGVCFIHWEDITDIKSAQLANTKFLLIHVSNPEYYLEQGKRGKRSIMKWNYNVYGTPLCISSDLLKCKLNRLEIFLEEKVKNNKANIRLQNNHVKSISWPNKRIAGRAFG